MDICRMGTNWQRPHRYEFPVVTLINVLGFLFVCVYVQTDRVYIKSLTDWLGGGGGGW